MLVRLHFRSEMFLFCRDVVSKRQTYTLLSVFATASKMRPYFWRCFANNTWTHKCQPLFNRQHLCAIDKFSGTFHMISSNTVPGETLFGIAVLFIGLLLVFQSQKYKKGPIFLCGVILLMYGIALLLPLFFPFLSGGGLFLLALLLAGCLVFFSIK